MATIVFADQWHTRADKYWNQGQSFKRQKKYKRAIESFNNAARSERRSNNIRVVDFIKQIQEISGLYGKLKDYKNARKYSLAMSRLAKRYRRPLYQGIGLQNAADASINLNRNNEAIQYLNQALKLFVKVSSLDRQIIVYNSLGRAYRQERQYQNSLFSYQRALKKTQKLGLKRNSAAVLANIGILYYFMKDYSRALEYQKKAIDLDNKYGNSSDISSDLSNISQVYLQLGRFGEAVNYLERSLIIEKRLNNKERIAARYNSLGEIYFRLGQNIKALNYFNSSLEINRLLKLKINEAALLHKIGLIYEQNGDKSNALNYYIRALSLDKSLKAKRSIQRNLSDIGMTYERRGRYDEALDSFSGAYKNKSLRRKTTVAIDLINIGRMYISLNEYTKALNPLFKAKNIADTLNNSTIKADVHMYFGIVYYHKMDFPLSVKNLRAAEVLLSGQSKRSIKSLYHLHEVQTWLVAAQYKKKSAGQMIKTADRMIQYKLNYGLKYKTRKITLPELQRVIPQKTAHLIYPVMCSHETFIIIVTKDRIHVRKLEVDEFLKNLGKDIALKVYKHRLSIDEKTKVNFKRSKRPKGVFYDLQDVINYYRSLHMKKSITREDMSEITLLGKKFYKLLIQPAVVFLQDKNKLVIRPDCVLSTFPFGTLVNGNNRYLEEDYEITLSVSLSQYISSFSNKQKYGTNTLIMGNPLIRNIKYKMVNARSSRFMDVMTEKACITISTGSNMSGVFKLCSSSKPGKIKYASGELKYLNNVIKGSTLFQERKASEAFLKKLSRQGRLKKYDIIHLVINGIIVPEVPELSSLLFTQTEALSTGQDGYLNVKELSSLKMKSRLLWLSYVDLPEGRINMRNGVGKLVQALHRGGARGIVLPLWKIDDSFRAFISAAVYETAKTYKISYSKALNLVKRVIILSDYSLDRKNIVKKHLKGLKIADINRFKSPYYWSAYQYYGR